MDSIETLHNKKMVVAENVGSIRSRLLQISTDDPWFWLSWTNFETVLHKITVAAETVVFRFEENFFLVPIIIGFGRHGQH